MAYFTYSCEGTLKSDIIVGTSIGSIGVISGHKLYFIEGTYHTKMVNCIKVAYIDGSLVIMTAGMDDLIKIFDFNFRPLLNINVRKKEQKTNTTLAVQSLDLFTCGEVNYLLFGSKCGEIVEHTIGYFNQAVKPKSSGWKKKDKSGIKAMETNEQCFEDSNLKNSNFVSKDEIKFRTGQLKGDLFSDSSKVFTNRYLFVIFYKADLNLNLSKYF